LWKWSIILEATFERREKKKCQRYILPFMFQKEKILSTLRIIKYFKAYLRTKRGGFFGNEFFNT
jgi:hypothetical protein